VIVGLGIDLVETERVERLLDSWGRRLLARLMDDDEAEGLLLGENPPLALARAIAAKEAASKALGTGWSRGVQWRDVVLHRRALETVPAGPSVELSLELRREALRMALTLGSSGRTLTRFQETSDLILAEVWLLSR
jgi:holo-[acyl-carrier-protein] synthase